MASKPNHPTRYPTPLARVSPPLLRSQTQFVLAQTTSEPSQRRGTQRAGDTGEEHKKAREEDERRFGPCHCEQNTAIWIHCPATEVSEYPARPSAATQSVIAERNERNERSRKNTECDHVVPLLFLLSFFSANMEKPHENPVGCAVHTACPNRPITPEHTQTTHSLALITNQALTP